jgi:hypothetical protein
MVEALENDELIHEAPAIVGRQTRRRSHTPRRLNSSVAECGNLS